MNGSVVETDYVIELLLDQAKLSQDDRQWLRSVRGTWMTRGQRERLRRLHELALPEGKSKQMETTEA